MAPKQRSSKATRSAMRGREMKKASFRMNTDQRASCVDMSNQEFLKSLPSTAYMMPVRALPMYRQSPFWPRFLSVCICIFGSSPSAASRIRVGSKDSSASPHQIYQAGTSMLTKSGCRIHPRSGCIIHPRQKHCECASSNRLE